MMMWRKISIMKKYPNPNNISDSELDILSKYKKNPDLLKSETTDDFDVVPVNSFLHSFNKPKEKKPKKNKLEFNKLLIDIDEPKDEISAINEIDKKIKLFLLDSKELVDIKEKIILDKNFNGYSYTLTIINKLYKD